MGIVVKKCLSFEVFYSLSLRCATGKGTEQGRHTLPGLDMEKKMDIMCALSEGVLDS